MKLEIIKGKKPLTRHNVTEASQFIGKECYFSDDLDNFEYLDEFKDKLIVDGDYSNMYKGKLLGIFANDNAFIVDENDIGSRFDYCLPAEWVQERKKPKYRPYTLEEFQDQFHFGICIILRQKNDRSMEFHVTYNGYKVLTDRNIVELYLGPAIFTLPELFDEYERFENGKWLPFGVEK